MIVCVCHRISDRDITRAARSGCTSFDDLQMELGVATCCGRCSDCAQTTLAGALADTIGSGRSMSAQAGALALA